MQISRESWSSISKSVILHTESFKLLMNKWSEILNNRSNEEGSQVFFLSCLRVIARVGDQSARS